MRGLRTTIGLAVVLVALGGYIYFADPQADDEDEATTPVFAVTAENIEALQVTAANGEVTKLQRTDGVWRITEPVAADAAIAELDTITKGLSTLERVRSVEGAEGLSQYGLDPPRIEVAFRVAGSQDFQRLLLGDRTPGGADLYARLPDDEGVFLVSSFLENTYNRTTFDLRDRSVLKFDRQTIDALSVTEGSRALEFGKKGEAWTIARPVSARAEYSAVEALVGALSTTEVQRFVDEDATALAQYGLDAPTLTATVRSGDAEVSLFVGHEVDGTRYARDSSRPGVFTVGDNLIKELRKGPDEYRRKAVFETRPFSATRFEIQRGSATMTLSKTKDADERDVWQLNGETIETSKAEDPLMKLTALRAEAFLVTPTPALSAPELTVTVTGDDGTTTETVRFAREGGAVQASRADEPGSALVSTSEYEVALEALDALQ